MGWEKVEKGIQEEEDEEDEDGALLLSQTPVPPLSKPVSF